MVPTAVLGRLRHDRRSCGGRKITASYVSRTLWVTYLSPKIIEAIVDGRHPSQLTMKELIEPFPMERAAQERWFLR